MKQISRTSRFGWLGPEIPSISCTFVYREVREVRAAGAEVFTWSLHEVPLDGLAEDAREFHGATRVLYRGAVPMLRGALRAARRRPLNVLRVGCRMVGDLLAGRFSRPRQRLRLPLQFLAAIDLAGQLREARIEHLHVHFAHAPATVGMYAADLAGIPFSVTAHANDLFVEGSLLRQKALRAKVFLTISAANQRHLSAVTGLPEKRFGISRCGVDVDHFSFRGESAARRAADRRRVFTVGRMVPKKGFDLLLEAAAPLVRDGQIRELVLAGDGPERTSLEARAKELGIDVHVQFAGIVDRARIRSELEQSAVFALPCRRAADGDIDGIPVVLMEAMAVGVPVLSTPLSGIPELIEDRVSGRLAEPEPLSLEKALRALLANPVLAQELAVVGRSRVVDEFSAEDNAVRLVNVLRAG